MLKTLLTIQLRRMLDSLVNRRMGKNGKGMKIVFSLLMAYCVVVFLGLFGGLFYVIYEPFKMIGMGWLYYALAGVLATGLCFIGSVFFTQSVLFEAKDNELLLSLPIKPAAILGSRMLLILLLNYAFSAIIILPCGVVRCLLGGVTAGSVVRFIAAMVLLPLLPTTLSCVVGYLVALITAHMRNKNLFTLILSVLFLGVYFVFCFNMQTYMTLLMENGAAIGEAIQKSTPPFYALGVALDAGNVKQLLVWLLWCIVPFAAVYAVLSKSFIRIATMKRGAKKVRYEARSLKMSSVRWALTKKELCRLASSANYMLNACMGAAMAVVFGVVALVKGKELLQMLGMTEMLGVDLSVCMGAIACALVCMMMSMNVVSAPSVSLEGKNLWLMQSIPVRGGDVLLAKAYAHMAVCVPFGLIASVLFVIALPMAALDAALVIIVPAVLSVFCALLGVTVNLRFPRFDYVNEAIAVKQGMSTGICMLGSMGVVALPVILYLAVFKAKFAPVYMMIGFALLLAIASVWMYYYLENKADHAFAKLNQE